MYKDECWSHFPLHSFQHDTHYTRPTSSSGAPLFVTPILITITSTTVPLHPRNDKTKSTGYAADEEVHVI